jgi:hypothetical protein
VFLLTTHPCNCSQVPAPTGPTPPHSGWACGLVALGPSRPHPAPPSPCALPTPSPSPSAPPPPSPHSFILVPTLIPSYPEGNASLREMSRQHFFNKPGPASPFRQSRQDLAGEACHVPASAENHDILSTALTKCRLSASQRQHLFADCKVSGIFIILLNSFDLALCSRSFSLRSKANSFYRSVIWSD